MISARYGTVNQIGILVDDLDASIDRWISMLGVGPWTVFRNARLDGNYRGRKGVVAMDVGLAFQGDVQIELIKITNETPSPYRDASGRPLKGMHHIAWLAEDLDAAVRRAVGDGLKLVFEGNGVGTRVAYLEAPDEPGILFEFIESDAMPAMFRDGIPAARNWDGSNPVTVINMAG